IRSVCYSYFPCGTNILVIGGQSCIVSVEVVGSKATAAVGIIQRSPQTVHLGPKLPRTRKEATTLQNDHTSTVSINAQMAFSMLIKTYRTSNCFRSIAIRINMNCVQNSKSGCKYKSGCV